MARLFLCVLFKLNSIILFFFFFYLFFSSLFYLARIIFFTRIFLSYSSYIFFHLVPYLNFSRHVVFSSSSTCFSLPCFIRHICIFFHFLHARIFLNCSSYFSLFILSYLNSLLVLYFLLLFLVFLFLVRFGTIIYFLHSHFPQLFIIFFPLVLPQISLSMLFLLLPLLFFSLFYMTFLHFFHFHHWHFL